MGEPLKTFFSPALVRRLADDLARVEPGFPARAFAAQASAGLDELELMDRAKHLAAALARHLPPSFPEAIDVLLRSLGPEHATDELVGVGMAPFYYLPHVLFVAERGLEHFDLSMRAQVELTKRFSAEMSIRPYLAAEPERTLAVMRGWARDRNAHVRRLVSEGTRLRLPWAMRVPWLDRNPERVVELLDLLVDDPTTLVRRSVANNLNDLGKVHPQLLVDTCARWLAGASTAERRALVEHALRSAIKRGEPGALALLGYGARPAVAIEAARLAPRRVPIGGRVAVSFTLRSTARAAQALLVDLRVHFVKAGGAASPKVFKLDRVALPARGTVALSTSVSLAVHTTRVPRPGRHRVEVLVNGHALPLGAFEVIAVQAGMAFDEKLADRVRRAVGPRADVTEKKMFGGVAFLLGGKMFCGVTTEDLMVRVGAEGHEAALAEPHARPMDFTGRPMKGYVFVGPAGTRTDRAVAKWTDRALAFVATVEKPRKPRKPRPPRRRA